MATTPAPSLPKYEANLSISSETGDTVLHVTIHGTARAVEQVIVSSADAFKEDAER